MKKPRDQDLNNFAKPQESTSEDSQPIFHSLSIKPKLTSEQTTAEDLKRHLILVFGSYKKASNEAALSESRLHQIFMGYKVPENPDILKRIASGWNVDIVLLTKIFENLRREK